CTTATPAAPHVRARVPAPGATCGRTADASLRAPAQGRGARPRISGTARTRRRRSRRACCSVGAVSRFDELREQRLVAGRARDASRVVVERDEVTSVQVDDRRAGLATDQRGTEVVPLGYTGLDTREVAVEPAVRDGTEIERHRAERAVLPPPEVERRQ